MALEASDVFVVQKAAGDVRKVTAQDLNTYLENSQVVVYKGTADFTDVGETPASPQPGDLWFNSALAEGGFAWTPAPNPIPTARPGDRALYNGTTWDVISSGDGDSGVLTVTGTAPIDVNNDSAANPVISVDNATTTAVGVVQLATDTDVNNSAVNRVVTADQLKDVIDDLDAATAGGLTSVKGVDPIEVETNDDNGNGGSLTSPAILIKDAGVGQKGAIARFDSTATVGGPESNTDYATWVAALDDTDAITLKTVGSNFLLSDFSEYPDA